MKSEELKMEIIKKYLDEWIDGKYNFRKNGIVDVTGAVKIRNYPYSKLIVKFGKVSLKFDCADNNLETLEGCPKKIGTSFYCQNNRLTSLEHITKNIPYYLYCHNNPGNFTTEEIDKYVKYYINKL